MSFSRLWSFMAVVLPVLAALLATVSTVDLAYQVRAGQLMLDQGAILRTDPFTFTAGGQPWLDQQWGAQVVFALIYRATGWAGLAVVRALLVGLVVGFVYLVCRREGAAGRIAAWLTLAGFGVAAIALGMRPQLIGMVLFAATLLILAGRERSPRSAWIVPVLVVVWANVHGSFFLGPLAVEASWLEDVVRHRPGTRSLFIVGVVSVVATVVSPFGIGVWSYAFGIAGDPVIRRIVSEWQPTSPTTVPGVLVYGSAAVVMVFMFTGRRAGRFDPSDPPAGDLPTPITVPWPRIAWLVGLFAVAALTQRGIAWWALAAPVAVAPLAARLAERRASAAALAGRPSPPEPVSRLNTIVVALLVLVGVGLLPMWRSSDPLAGPAGLLTDAPTGIADHLAALATRADRVWNAQGWGSWLELTVPGVPLAVDSRIEVIPAAAWEDALALDGGPADWAAILDRWHVTIVVASRVEQGALIPLLEAGSEWHVAYEDADGAIFVRNGPAG